MSYSPYIRSEFVSRHYMTAAKSRTWVGRLGGVFLAVTLVAACRSGTPAPLQSGQTVAPGTQALKLPEARERPVSFKWVASPASDTIGPPIPLSRTEIIERHVTESGAPALLQIINVPARQWTDTLLVRRASLAPVWERARIRDRTIRVDYEGARVRWLRRVGDSTASQGDSTYARPVFAFNQLEMIVRSMPLEVGHTIVVPLYSEGTPEMELDTLTVVSAPAAGAAAEAAWTIRFADAAIVSTYRLSPTTREILGVEVLRRATGTRFQRVPAP